MENITENMHIDVRVLKVKGKENFIYTPLILLEAWS